MLGSIIYNGAILRKEKIPVWLENLNRLKKSSSMTIEEISCASGVPKGTLNKLFAGQTKDPQLSTVSAVVHCMGYTLDDLSDDTVSGKIQLTPAQTALLDNFDQLNEEGQTKALDYVEDLVLTGRYKKAAAHGVAAKEAQKITASASRSGQFVYGGILCPVRPISAMVLNTGQTFILSCKRRPVCRMIQVLSSGVKNISH